MHELPKDLTNSLRSFRGSIYGRGHSQQGEESARVDNTGLEQGPEDYGDKEFDRALETSQSSLDMQSTAEIQNVDQIQPNPRDDGDIDLEKQERRPRFEEEEEVDDDDNDEYDAVDGRNRPRLDTSMDMGGRNHMTPNTPGKLSVFHGAAHIKDPDPAADRLAEDLTPMTKADFYVLMGLNPPTPSTEDIKQLIKPGGLYGQIAKQTRYTTAKYHAFAIAVYVFLVLQLVISAVFIILGSLRNVDTHITIAVLGAVSTIIAGSLALMQGQGLPNRLRQTRDDLRYVLFAADELYWDVKTGRNVLYKDIKKIREDYLRVVEEQRSNQPDVWQSTTKDMEQGVSNRTLVTKR